MFIDASVIVAILGREAGYEEIEKRLADSEGPFFISPLVKYLASCIQVPRSRNEQREG